MVFLAARGRRRPNDCFGVGALCRTRPKSERLRIRAALIVWARVAFVEPNDDARATTPDAKVEKGRRHGELLRRYWQPVCPSDELSDLPKKVKILCEELIVFRDKKGRVGALEPHCSHRGTSLEYGRIEEEGIRCCYHWVAVRDRRAEFIHSALAVVAMFLDKPEATHLLFIGRFANCQPYRLQLQN
jgi:hypothetical protein